MKSASKKYIKNFLFFMAIATITVVNCYVIRYILDIVFGWFGGEDSISWQAILITCAVLSVAMIIAEIILRRKGVEGMRLAILCDCRSITLMTTVMFGGFVLLETFIGSPSHADALFDTERWLSLSIAMGILNHLYARRQRLEIERDGERFVVAMVCSDMSSAEAVSATLEAHGIKNMIVEKGSPIYIKEGNAPVQIQVCKKELETAKNIIAK